jgi:hypothetical protein
VFLQEFPRTSGEQSKAFTSNSGNTGPDHPENPAVIPKREANAGKGGAYDLIAEAGEIRVLFGPNRSISVQKVGKEGILSNKRKTIIQIIHQKSATSR